MTQITIGEVDWETADLPGENRMTDFMTLKQGDNKGRVLSNPQQFAVHWVVDETGKKRKINCATAGCPVCQRAQEGDKAQARWLIKFFNREESRVQLLEISSQILKGVKALVTDSDWGPVTEYDINIKRGAPGVNPLYNVTPGRRSPLTTEEKTALAAFNERVDVSRFTTPPTPEVVAEKLGWAPAAAKSAVSNDFRSGNRPSTPAAARPQAPGAKAKIDFDFE